MIFHQKKHPNLGDPHTVGSPAAACVTGATPRAGAGGFGPWTATKKRRLHVASGKSDIAKWKITMFNG